VITSPLLQLPNTYRAFYGSFTALRAFQQEVIAPLLNGQDLILQAATGSGKTEAVLAPCLERIMCAARQGAVLYVVPTRALVHDLRRRLEPLLHERLGVPLGIRTGDVKRLPGGRAHVLLTTPESLDVMLGSANREVRAFLERVTTLVVDEVHQLVQGYRGHHLAYLVQRLERRSQPRLQKIALSATLTEPQAIRDGLGLRADAVWISSPVQRQMRPHMIHLKREPDELIGFIDDLARRFGARKLLLFANSRSRCDQLFGWLRQRGYFQQATYLHYSNLKLKQRQEVERQFQRRTQALCIATSTLELGIDVGDVDCVILYEPPGSVTTFLQRIGRANRQSQTTTFWGICRGPQAGEQLLQFLALYTLAQQGAVEVVQPSRLPSVLVQQVLSNLYEHKRVSLEWLQMLFPQQAKTLDTLLPALEATQWLRRLAQNGRQASWRGGWRYTRALKAHQIWSNFPDTAEPYTLEVEAQAVADLPPSIVRQLEVGDQVELTGRCIRILDIQAGDRKVVRAVPIASPHERVLYWVGTGPPVSWEVAQAMRPLVQPDYAPETTLAQGLFSRTRTLLQQHRQGAERRVVLHNGIELSRTPHGFYRYATYLGSVGNFIVQRIIEDYYGPRLQEFFCSANAIAVECSHRIDFRPLPLPSERQAFRRWVSQHLRALRVLFAFNAFCQALPRPLLVDEAMNLLWDARLLEAFVRYRQQSSEIATGDPQVLAWQAPPETHMAQQSTTALLCQGPQPSILHQEKARLGLTSEATPHLAAVPAHHRAPRALTGTMVGTYIQHEQCDRLLSFDLLPYDQQPAKRTLVDSDLGAARAEQGTAFEAWVLEWLERQGIRLYRVPEHDTTDRRLSLQERQAWGFDCLRNLAQAHAQRCEAGEPACDRMRALGQAVLMLPNLSGTHTPVDGVGIPDLIEVTMMSDTVVLTIADIKDSSAPRYSQKWQVAFYAALLRACVRRYTFALPVQVADTGVLYTRPETPGAAPTRHAFDLSPYLEALPLLLRRVTEIVTTPVTEAAWQLQAHCTSCAYIDTCYGQALSTDDVMLLPHLTPGEHLKLHTAGLHTLPQAARWAQEAGEEHDLPMSAQQATQLRTRIRALTANRVELLNPTTSLYPINISTVLFVHLLRHPHSGKPRAWGLRRLTEPGTPEAVRCWIATTEADMPACQEAFIADLRRWWHEAISSDRGPHLVTFGVGSLHLLRQAMDDTAEPRGLDFLWTGEAPRHTDLRQVLRQHFALPIPLRMTLLAAARVWGLKAELTPPPYLLQDETDETAEVLLQARLSPAHVARVQQYLSAHLKLQQQVWQICTTHVHSAWRQQTWSAIPPTPQQTWERDCVEFLEQQQHWREQDILALQQLPLAERAERYRALGPLQFETTTLDAEGRFLVHFQLPAEAQPTRFRPGDFLRLNPVGSPDLQAGASVILAQYEPHAGRLAVIVRQGQVPSFSTRLRYALDEDLENWTTPRVLHAVREVFTPGKHPDLTALLDGALPLQHPAPGLAWAQDWLQRVELNGRQREALLLPFRSRLGLIEGPPGTGKTHLLACMLIALLLEASEVGRPLRLAVSALTHQAIDNVLLKVQELLQSPVGRNFPGVCLKWGRRLSLADDAEEPALTYAERADEVLQAPYVILGATGFGLYQLFESQAGHFPAFFDWVIVDEASQVLLPQALLSLAYGKGQYIFCGDIRQLPPVVRGPQATDNAAQPERSILAHLTDIYDAAVRVRLNQTYRLNQALCELPSRLWYQGDLRPAELYANARLVVPPVQHPDIVDTVLDPQRPATLVLADHTTDQQQSPLEVDIITVLAARLLLNYGLEPERLAILAPHRAQNNAIVRRLSHLLARHRSQDALALPVIDTVERLQGAERDVVLFSLTTSDPDRLESPFLNNPNRFNVAITRARHKLIVVGSTAFLTLVPRTETALQAHQGFTAYYHLCRERQALFACGQQIAETITTLASHRTTDNSVTYKGQ
jgi:superfamily II DNA/RNA helicase